MRNRENSYSFENASQCWEIVASSCCAPKAAGPEIRRGSNHHWLYFLNFVHSAAPPVKFTHCVMGWYDY